MPTSSLPRLKLAAISIRNSGVADDRCDVKRGYRKDHLLWHARTFRRQVVHRYFATWQALEQANTRLWETTYAPAARYALRPTWHVWLVDYRKLLVLTREVYEGHHSQRETAWRP